MKKLFYLPLESYVERYTYFMSCPDGWTETWFKNYRVPFVRVDGVSVGSSITVGSVLDAFGRSRYAMSQIMAMVNRIQAGEVHDGDVVYTEDFWHPGIESLFYVRDLTGINFKVGCFIHAQSIDDTDFTWPMRRWMRPIEVGMSVGYDYIFTCSDILRGIAEKAGYDGSHLFKVGLPYNSRCLCRQLREMGLGELPKEDFVLFSSRFDKEKNPHFFLDLVEACPDIEFKLVKPRKHITNDIGVQEHLDRVLSSCANLEVVDTSDKLSYYSLLSRARVQFNCAFQDWVSWTLLEAITFGCMPLYPDWKDFPTELAGFEKDHIYPAWELDQAAKQLRNLMGQSFNPQLMSVVHRHDQSWFDYLVTMGFVL